MGKNIYFAFIAALILFAAHSAVARETAISTGINTGVDYSNRTYDDETELVGELVIPPLTDSSSPADC